MRSKKVIHPDYEFVKAGVRTVFRTLRSQGIVARMNYDVTLTSGSYALAAEAEKKHARGYCFYHSQTEMHFRKDGELYIAYGGAQDWYNDEENIPENGLTNLEAGELVARIIGDQPNLKVVWDHDPRVCIHVSRKMARRGR